MSTPKRKIGFYSLTLRDNDDESQKHPPKSLSNILGFIVSLNKVERIYDIASSNKFHLMDSVQTNGTIQNLIFESAKYYHRPPLINKDTAIERDNPKELTEGELEKTHVSLKYLSKEIILIMEERKVGIAIGSIRSYLAKFQKKYQEDKQKILNYRIELATIPKGDFLRELEALKRVQFGNVYVEKQLLGSEFLNFSNRLEEVQENIIITVKAKRKMSPKDVIRDVYKKFTTERSRINKIRIYGYNKEGNQVLLDTDIIKKIEYVTVELDDATGIVNSSDIFNSFHEILNEYS